MKLKAATILALGLFSANTNATLLPGTVLTFDSSVGCPVGAQCIVDDGMVYGSYFAIDANLDGVLQASEKTAITAGYDGGLIIGSAQFPANLLDPNIRVLPGAGIDAPWQYYGEMGWHETHSPVTVLNEYGVTKELDFSGWTVNFNGTRHDLGADLIATLMCETQFCADGERFTLDYSTFVPNGFTRPRYTLHLEGTISAVPVPAAAWLFGTGLISLAGMARRKKLDKTLQRES